MSTGAALACCLLFAVAVDFGFGFGVRSLGGKFLALGVAPRAAFKIPFCVGIYVAAYTRT